MDKKLNREEGTSEKLITYVKDRPGHDLRYAIDSSKLQKELGWSPIPDFADGLEKTVEWYLTNTRWLERSYQVITVNITILCIPTDNS